MTTPMAEGFTETIFRGMGVLNDQSKKSEYNWINFERYIEM